jgi:hypothetical protein
VLTLNDVPSPLTASLALDFRNRLRRLDLSDIDKKDTEAFSALLKPTVLPMIRTFGCPTFRKAKSAAILRQQRALEKRAAKYGVAIVKTEQHWSVGGSCAAYELMANP